MTATAAKSAGGGAIVVLNSGSSSLKLAVYVEEADGLRLVFEGSAEGTGRQDGGLHLRSADGTPLVAEDHVAETQEEALRRLAAALSGHYQGEPIAVGHRVVHGGPKLREHQRITPGVLDQLRAAVHFAPLHVPQAVALIEEAQRTYPNVAHFACFDDAFHRTMPEVAAHLPIPKRYFDQGVMRYGFHGLSCESVVERLRDRMPERMIVAHLGNGSSVTAIRSGRSIDTSMGLTPTGGIPMGTRSGDLDPGVLLYLMRTDGVDADGLEHMLNKECGLAGLSGGESDMRQLLARSEGGNAPAQLAVDAFCVAVRKSIGAYAALMGGVDLLVFTGGIGEHSDAVRQRVCGGLDFIALREGSERVLVLPAQEELQIARHCQALLAC